MRIRISLLLTLTLAALGSPREAKSQSPFSGLPFVRNFNTTTYHGGIQNYSITHDKRGLLYVANNFGLLEYDGDQWRIFPVKTGTKVRSVAVDSKGRIYVGCQGDFGYFFPDASGQLVYTSLADSIDSRYRNFDETWNVFIEQNKVYFSTLYTIFIYDGKLFEIVQAPHTIELSFFVNRRLFVNERGVGIRMLEGSSFKSVKGGEYFSTFSVSSMFPLFGDEMLVSTLQNGIFRLKGGKTEPWNERNQEFFKEANITCMIRLKNGQFAAGTQNNGLLVLDADGNIILQMTRDRGLENRTVLSLWEDDIGNLWVGQNNGIAYVELGSPFTFINEQSGLPGTGYTAYLHGEKLFLGTNTGLYQQERSKPGKYVMLDNSRGQVYHVGLYNTNLLMGHHNGAFRVDGSKVVQISKAQGSWVYQPLRDYPDKLIEGTYRGLQLYSFEGGIWKFKKKLSGFEESSRIMAEDRDGSVWVTHGYKGAFRITLNESRDSILNVSFYGDKKGFPTSRLINVFRIRDELLFSAEFGVYKYNQAKDAFVPDGLFSSTLGQSAQIWYIQEDAMGNIYFIGREHIGVFRKNSRGDYELQANEFNKIRKYLNDDLENITILKNDEVLFGARDGFIHYNPTFQFGKKPVFTALIRRVTSTVNGDSVLFSGSYNNGDSVVMQQLESFKPSLPFWNNSLNFTFAANSYEGDADLVYQCYLENYERDWSGWSAKTFREYTNLKENLYVFHVRSRNVNGEMSKEATFAFRIYPPWYRSSWAYTFYSLAGIAFMFIGFSLLDRRYQRQRQQMALEQEKQLSKKDVELEQLSIQTQEEINRLQNEKLESELHHMKNELATATMHLLNKNEFITGIKTELNQIVKKSTHEELKKDLQHISREIETNISDDADWEHFQFHFDRVHGDFTARLKASFTTLSPQETKLSAYLRMNLSSKEIAQLLNISVRGVEISRYRLRKKLQLDRNQNLQEFILNF